MQWDALSSRSCGESGALIVVKNFHITEKFSPQAVKNNNQQQPLHFSPIVRLLRYSTTKPSHYCISDCLVPQHKVIRISSSNRHSIRLPCVWGAHRRRHPGDTVEALPLRTPFQFNKRNPVSTLRFPFLVSSTRQYDSESQASRTRLHTLSTAGVAEIRDQKCRCHKHSLTSHHELELMSDLGNMLRPCCGQSRYRMRCACGSYAQR